VGEITGIRVDTIPLLQEMMYTWGAEQPEKMLPRRADSRRPATSKNTSPAARSLQQNVLRVSTAEKRDEASAQWPGCTREDRHLVQRIRCTGTQNGIQQLHAGRNGGNLRQKVIPVAEVRTGPGENVELAHGVYMNSSVRSDLQNTRLEGLISHQT